MDGTLMRALIVSAGVSILSGCDSGAEAAVTPARPSVALISAESFGDDWPFTTEEMHLSCLQGSAVVVTDVETGIMYPVNGNAHNKTRQLGLEPLDGVWRDDPSIDGLKVSVSSVIEQGLKFCR